MLPIEIRTVETRSERKAWLELPWKINASDPNWMPPLRKDQKELAGFGHHPVYDQATSQAFLAIRDGQPVGRILAITNSAHNKTHNDQVGFFGFYESIDDQEVANKLFASAEAWLNEQGMDVARGPMNPTLNYGIGLLVDGFDTPPYFLLTHNPEYYQRLFDGAGYEKAQDLYSYWGDVSMVDALLNNQKINNVDQMVRERFGVNIRSMNTKRFGA